MPERKFEARRAGYLPMLIGYFLFVVAMFVRAAAVWHGAGGIGLLLFGILTGIAIAFVGSLVAYFGTRIPGMHVRAERRWWLLLAMPFLLIDVVIIALVVSGPAGVAMILIGLAAAVWVALSFGPSTA